MGSIRRIPLLLLLAVPAAQAADRRALAGPAQPHPATVNILAISSSVHQGFAGNQEVYLADVVFHRGEHHLAKLVDFYSQAANPIERSLLVDRRALRIALARDSNCDAPARQLLVAARPTNIFDASLPSTLASQPDASIPCYRVIHESIRISKK